MFIWLNRYQIHLHFHSYYCHSIPKIVSILCRWLYIHEQCLDIGIRVIGFANDADGKYLNAMKYASGKCSHLSATQLMYGHVELINHK